MENGKSGCFQHVLCHNSVIFEYGLEILYTYLFINHLQGVSENTDTFLSLPALVFIKPQTSLGARFDL